MDAEDDEGESDMKDAGKLGIGNRATAAILGAISSFRSAETLREIIDDLSRKGIVSGHVDQKQLRLCPNRRIRNEYE